MASDLTIQDVLFLYCYRDFNDVIERQIEERAWIEEKTWKIAALRTQALTLGYLLGRFNDREAKRTLRTIEIYRKQVSRGEGKAYANISRMAKMVSGRITRRQPMGSALRKALRPAFETASENSAEARRVAPIIN